MEIYFSVLERKVLTLADATSLEALGERILDFQSEYQRLARPFEWRFTRADLARLLHGLAEHGAGPLAAAARNTFTEYPSRTTKPRVSGAA